MARKEQQIDISYKDQKIVDIGMEKEVKKSFIEYAMSVIMSRALPDVRDGLKPVHRRILYSMYEDHLTYDRPTVKSAKTVGNVLGNYHPHGDSSVYDAMVRLAQTFSMRYPLIDGQGNFGTIDGDPPAAYRYTEARMSKIASYMLQDIEKDVVDFAPNFDNKCKEPTVLPAKFPNLLVNGCIGIAVGMATNIPTHNLGEVIDGVICLMDNPEATIPQLMEHIKGPDFPTGATICGTNGIYSAYMTGNGRITVRGKAEIDHEKHRIIITEIPYMVNKSMLVESMANCYREKKVEGLTALRDESSKSIRIVIEYRRDMNGEVILNQLYKYTSLQDTCAVNMLVLVDGIPRVLNLKQVLEYYIEHSMQVVTRRTEFELKKALAEMHILEGYKIAIDNIDEVIAIIKASESVSDARAKLMERFGLSEAQAQAIVDMTLGKLSGMERIKVEERLAKLAAIVTELQGILADNNKIKQIVKDELLEVKAKFADARRTEIVPVEDEIMIEDLIERHTCIVTMSKAGYIKRVNENTYQAQHRGGKGIIGMTTKEEDFVEKMVAVDSHSLLMFFTNLGKVQAIKAYRLPEAGRTAKGTSIVNILELREGEKVNAMLSVPQSDTEGYLFFVTKNGVVKRTAMTEFERHRKTGKNAINLDEGDELVFVCRTFGKSEIIIATKNGMAVRFDENDARVMGRSARGVRGIKLVEGDEVCAAALVEDNGTKLLTVTEKGYGKLSDFDNFKSHARGGKGVSCQKISEKTGRLCGIAACHEEDDLMMITNEGAIIRTPISGISTFSRTAGGVILMRLAEEARIVNFTCVAPEDEEALTDDEIVENEDTAEEGGEELELLPDDDAVEENEEGSEE
ncbi:MAG: DNA gyrase subunit A [Ruminococcaceae bacterium]|nr:DNA gyrase subunit A [Oscillospiraceae bacterium]